jgi:hypothetical protein
MATAVFAEPLEDLQHYTCNVPENRNYEQCVIGFESCNEHAVLISLFSVGAVYVSDSALGGPYSVYCLLEQ